jgi:thymidylate synthase (FAD)
MNTRINPSLCAGTDLDIANAARQSFGIEYATFRSDADGPRSARGRSDETLIRELLRDQHLLPFRHPQLSFSCEAPLPVARQLGKHQSGLSWSEVSRRYKVKDLQFYRINGQWRCAPVDARQGSGELLPMVTQEDLNALQERNILHCLDCYEGALKLGASPEQARFMLPQSMEVTWTWTGSFLAWMHLWSQRTHPDAQRETEAFVRSTEPAILERFPYSWPIIRRNQARMRRWIEEARQEDGE